MKVHEGLEAGVWELFVPSIKEPSQFEATIQREHGHGGLTRKYFKSRSEADGWLNKQLHSLPTRLGKWQHAVLTHLSERAFNPLIFLQNRAAVYKHSYKKSLWNLEVKGLISWSQRGFKGTSLWTITDRGRKFLEELDQKPEGYWRNLQSRTSNHLTSPKNSVTMLP